MSSSFTGSANSFLPEDFIIPQDQVELRLRLRQYFNDLSVSINKKDIGTYVTQEVVCGQSWLPTASTDASTSLVYRQVIRKVVLTGAVATGANAIAHGINVTGTSHFTRIYGIIENPGSLYVPVPNDTVLLTVDVTNINLTIPAAYNGFTGQIVMEWVSTD
jgi:hypothetical protein